MAYSDGPSGIGGWLAIFLVLRALGPILATGAAFVFDYADPTVAATFGSRWPAVQIAMWSNIAMNAAIDGFYIWRFLARRNWRTVQIGIGLLWFMSFVTIVVAPLSVHIAAGLSFATFTKTLALSSILAAFASSTFWTVYLLRSKRVANTYLRYGPADADELSLVFE
jgi:hypothetical protein